MTPSSALKDAIARLSKAGVSDPARDARILLGHATQRHANRLLSDDAGNLSSSDLAQFETLIAQRCQRQPVSQIIGKRAFWEHDFWVTPDVLDPRPETEHMIELALQGPLPRRMLDLGTGSGCIIVSLLAAIPTATGVATDISNAALQVAAKNAERIGVQDRLQVHRSDWFEHVEGKFDLILCNPPYISEAEMTELAADVVDWEPHAALTPGGDGLAAYREIAKGLNTYLAHKGRAIFECGLGQVPSLIELFGAAGFEEIDPYFDLTQRPRGVCIQKNS